MKEDIQNFLIFKFKFLSFIPKPITQAVFAQNKLPGPVLKTLEQALSS